MTDEKSKNICPYAKLGDDGKYHCNHLNVLDKNGHCFDPYSYPADCIKSKDCRTPDKFCIYEELSKTDHLWICKLTNQQAPNRCRPPFECGIQQKESTLQPCSYSTYNIITKKYHCGHPKGEPNIESDYLCRKLYTNDINKCIEYLNNLKIPDSPKTVTEHTSTIIPDNNNWTYIPSEMIKCPDCDHLVRKSSYCSNCGKSMFNIDKLLRKPDLFPVPQNEVDMSTKLLGFGIVGDIVTKNCQSCESLHKIESTSNMFYNGKLECELYSKYRLSESDATSKRCHCWSNPDIETCPVCNYNYTSDKNKCPVCGHHEKGTVITKKFSWKKTLYWVGCFILPIVAGVLNLIFNPTEKGKLWSSMGLYSLISLVQLSDDHPFYDVEISYIRKI